MYKNSYKGYKRKNKYKYKNSYKAKKEISTTRLQVIRVACVSLALIIILAIVFVVFIAVGHKPEYVNSNDKTSVIQSENRDLLLMVVNSNNPIDSDFVPELVEQDNYLVNKLANTQLDALLSQAKTDGYEITVNFAYISYKEQEEKYMLEYQNLLNSGYSQVMAEAKAQEKVQKAGESEYQTGLLVNFDCDNKSLKWLERHSVDFGFVKRFNDEGQSENAYIYRYVGVDDAKMMRTLGMNLDEYATYISIQQG